MIVKILSSAQNFAGIHYSERKNDQGKSALIQAKNFGALEGQTHVVKSDYINYMKAICALNPRVKNKQFHAVLSAKGKSYPAEKLAKIGAQFLEKMGYGKNPFLIYHHNDTDHTHIHLVSTRVDKNGVKVNDSYEKIRAQKALQEILSIDPKYEADQDVQRAFSYQFGTEAQFGLLMELSGYKIRKKDDQLELIKYGVVQRKVAMNRIQTSLKKYRVKPDRIRQLQNIFQKYAIGLSENQWKKLMKEQFNIDLVFHRKNPDMPPYGYTVIDHQQQYVYKGSQILRLSELQRRDQEEKARALIREYARQPGISFEEFRKAMAGIGLEVSFRGNVAYQGRNWDIDPALFQKLRYRDRLGLANDFKINGPGCKAVLARLLQVAPEDIKPTLLRDTTALKMTLEYLDDSGRWKEGLDHYQLRILNAGGTPFILSPNDLSLLDVRTLMGRDLAIPVEYQLDLQHMDEDRLSKLPLQSTSAYLEGLLEVLATSGTSQKTNREERKKNKTIKR